MKKLTLFLTILFLLFAVSANAAWLSGYDQRIELTVDNTKIDAALSHFPVTVILSSTHGDCVFDELTSDANRLKIAFTKSDGTTEMYGEIEKWDDANESAIIHVSMSGWSISSSADTDFYMYYDSDHADNTSYIGDIDSTPGHSVWDSNFKFVGHMVDATTSSVKDSTNNGTDGTKKGANEPIETTGKVGKGQDFDGTDDYIVTGAITINEITATCIIKHSSTLEWDGIAIASDDSSGNWWQIVNSDTNSIRCEYKNGVNAKQYTYDANTVVNDNAWHLVSMVVSNTPDMKIYVDGSEDTPYGKNCDTLTATLNITEELRMGTIRDEVFYGDTNIDEVRVSNTARSAAWIKATYNSLYDTLLTYGSEETTTTFIPRVIIF